MILDKNQLDVLKELLNIGVGRGAQVLNTMLSSHIQLQVPLGDNLPAVNLNPQRFEQIVVNFYLMHVTL